MLNRDEIERVIKYENGSSLHMAYSSHYANDRPAVYISREDRDGVRDDGLTLTKYEARILLRFLKTVKREMV